MGIEALRYGCGPCSWRDNSLATILIGVIYAAISAFVAGAGIWTASGTSFPGPHSDTPLMRKAEEDPGPRLAGVNDILAAARLPADSIPMGVIEIEGKPFAVLLERAGASASASAISGGGSAEVFDHEGRVVRRFTAIEHANSSWELIEYTRLPPEIESRISGTRKSANVTDDPGR